tara:strand:+ start:2696 stop:5482 length:2787 start_codon:yes stop_codon:yes gene_type:complete
MSGDDLIQKNLFGSSNDENIYKNSTYEQNSTYEHENFSDEELQLDAKKRPRNSSYSYQKNNFSNNEVINNETLKLVNEDSNSFKTVNKEELAPVLKHYVTLKEDNIDHLLLYRLGDFYECFFEDAILISEILEITLTSKDGGKKIGRVPMAGIPHHALERYSSELIKKNFSVVICDQIEKSPGKYGALIKRAITRVITPGTVIEEGMLVAKQNNWITAIYIEDTKNDKDCTWGISRADVSTGELIIIEGNSINKLKDEVSKLDASEIIIGSEEDKSLLHITGKKLKYTITKKTDFSLSEAISNIKDFYNISSIEGLGLKTLKSSTKSLGGLLAYLKIINPHCYENNSSVKISLDYPILKFSNENLIIDYQTKKNLEITHTQRENNYVGSLLWSIDRTYTCMGARCLRSWVNFPLINIKEISARQNVITNFLNSKKLRTETQNLLRAMGDLERLSSRACAGQASPRDLIAISEGLKRLPKLKSVVDLFSLDLPPWIQKLKEANTDLILLADKISKTLVEYPPLNISEGGLIHDGIDNILDGLRNVVDDYSVWLKSEEKKERSLSKIPNLKIQFHRTFGYYISINKSKVNQAPKHWIKRQTLTNEERFITTSIKSQESKIFQIKNRAATREYDIFCEIRNLVANKTKDIRSIARSIAGLDALLGLSLVSLENNFIKPQIIPLKEQNGNNKTDIKASRNPIVEQLLDENKFIPNDILFDNNQKLIILTGPNASGKSCFIRQIGLIQILAQIGSFIPSKSAVIQVVDRIFTRVGAVDDQSTGQSTFMVEMAETASILNQATKSSLVLLDEIGRGTSTFDGLSIAWSVSEYLAKKINCKCIFATHYHELNYLQKSLDNVANFQVTVRNKNGRLDFCHKIETGGSNKSYGIEAARLAGVPIQVINKAENILNYLEKSNNFINNINLEFYEDKAA